MLFSKSYNRGLANDVLTKADLLFALFIVVIFITPMNLTALSTLDKDISKIKKDIHLSNTEFDVIKKEIIALNSEIDDLNREKKTTSVKIEKLSDALRSLTTKIQKINETYKKHRKTLKQLIKILEKTSIQAKRGEMFIEKNLISLSKTSASDKSSGCLLIADYDEGFNKRINDFIILDLIEKVNSFVNTCRLQKKNLAGKTKEIEQTIENLEVALGNFAGKISNNKRLQKNYKKFLSKLRKKQKKLRRELVDKEKSKKKIDALLKKFMQKRKDLITEKQKEKELDILRGSLPWPVKGKIISKFGKHKHPVLDTPIMNLGITIEASTTTVISVRAGFVSFSGHFKGYGKTVIIDHGGGFYTVTAGFADLAVKEKQIVKDTQPLGSIAVGDSIYFEIRRRNSSDDPLSWLIKMK